MTQYSLAYRTAASHVAAWADESRDLITLHKEAMECRDCEAFLQLGIDAFDWLNRADSQIQEQVLEETAAYDPEIVTALRQLYQAWLRPCEPARRWIQVQKERGFELDNLETFLRCEEEVRAILNPSRVVSGQIERMRDEALQENFRGETLDWYPSP